MITGWMKWPYSLQEISQSPFYVTFLYFETLRSTTPVTVLTENGEDRSTLRRRHPLCDDDGNARQFGRENGPLRWPLSLRWSFENFHVRWDVTDIEISDKRVTETQTSFSDFFFRFKSKKYHFSILCYGLCFFLFLFFSP